MPGDEIRSVMAVKSDEEVDLFRLYWEEECGIDVEDPLEGFVKEVSSWSRSAVEERLAELREWKRRESERWPRYGTEIGESETASPWKYLEAFAEWYDNVVLEDWYALVFKGKDTIVTAAMVKRGAVILEVTEDWVVFGRLAQGEHSIQSG